MLYAMISKARIKLISSLKAGKFRKQHGLFIAEGKTNVLDFIGSGLTCMGVYATSAWIAKEGSELKEKNLIETDMKEIGKMSSLKNPAEVLAVFKMPEFPEFDINLVNDLVLMLDSIRDPGNLGTIIRTADWFGIRQIVCSKDSVDAFSPKVVQASMGSLARVSVYYHDLEKLLQSKPDYLHTYGAVMDGVSVVDIAKPQRAVIVIGNEANGISGPLLSLLDNKITIPNTPAISGSTPESLNASIATAIVCYEFRR